MPGKSMGVGLQCQGNAGDDRGIYGSGCIVPWEYRGMQGNARERQGNVW